ncbi:hypothetical protein LS71_007175 [Helicobacter jaachi]|uniref:Sulfatase N-terminal domain-containing protein n=2 Tax=Helicobacter jaachi TaxID=1677920 RepID=A0A4U8T919_9HELI|nr:hypothetical protein LS71_007175 [Helicobacter jaachi]
MQFRTQRFTYFFLSVGLSCLVVLVFFKWLKHIFGIIFITLSILTCVSFVQILYSTPKNTESSSQSIAPYENELFSYSKTHKNIVIFVLDMFSGSHTPYIFAQFPYLKDNLSGFVLFDNTLSTTDSTIHSIATLIGGEYYAAYNMNARGDNLKESITKAFDDMGAHFVQNGYDVAYSLAVSAQGIKALKQYQQSGIFAIENLGRFQSYYLYEQNLQEQVERIYKNTYKDYQIVQLFSVGLFRFAPELYFRPRIYRNGMWLLRDTEHKNSDTLASITASSSFYAYTHIGNTNATKPTFKYLHSLMTHVPYRMYFHNKKCQFFSDKSAWNDYEHNAQMIETNEAIRAYYYQHYDTEACALLYLNDYVQWLKDNDIYDNTQIFVVSDHSGFDSIDIPIYSRPDALFLFKDFNAQGALEVDSRLMANYDIVSIFCENLPKGCPNVAPNVLKNYPKNRKVIHTLPISWIIDLHKTNQWIFNAAYSVEGDMHNKEHWRSIPLQDNQIPSELLHAH